MTAVISATPPHLPAPPLIQDEPLFEIIDGQRVELPPMSILASRVATRLVQELGYFLRTNPSGEAMVETLLHLALPVDRNRRPDVAYVSAQRIAAAPPQPGSDNAWDVVPELMVEVVSPRDLADEIMERLSEYFAAGARLVWIIYPTHRLVQVYDSPTQLRVLNQDDKLDGGSVLPGFQIPVATLFPG